MSACVVAFPGRLSLAFVIGVLFVEYKEGNCAYYVSRERCYAIGFSGANRAVRVELRRQ